MLIQTCAAASVSVFQDNFVEMWSVKLGGEVRNINAVDLTGDGIKEIVADSYYISSYGKSGTIFCLDRNGKQNWKYFAGLLEDSFGTPNGITVVGAGPYLEYVGPNGQAIWKRSTRFSASQKIFGQMVYSNDFTGNGEYDVAVNTNFGKKGSVLMLKDYLGEDIVQITMKPTENPYVLLSANIAGDEKHEILVGGIKYTINSVAETMQPVLNTPSSFMVYALDGTRLWDAVFESAVTSIEACDLDGDGLDEVIVGVLNRVYAYSGDGVPLWDEGVAGYVNDLDCGDINGDGTPEIAVAAEKVYLLKSDGSTLWSYSSGKSMGVKIFDFGSDGNPEVVLISNSLRILDKKGELLYKSENYGELMDLQVVDIEGDGYSEVIFAGKDGNVRLLKTRDYSINVGADNAYIQADNSFSKGDLNDSIKYAQKARELYIELGKQPHVDKCDKLIEKAENSLLGAMYWDIAKDYFEKKDYTQTRLYADKAMESYRKLNDIRSLNLIAELKKEALMIPNAGENYEYMKTFYGLGDWVNASKYALNTKSAYSYLGEDDKAGEAENIYVRSNLYIQFDSEIGAALGNHSIGLQQNATYYLSQANTTYAALNDPSLEKRLTDATQTIYSKTRDEQLLYYGGLAVFALLIILLFVFGLLAGNYLHKKGVFQMFEDGLTGLTKKESSSPPRYRYGGDSFQERRSGLRGIKKHGGESLTSHFKKN